MIIRVKKKHIRAGKQGESEFCPIALAVKDQLNAEYVCVDGAGVSVDGIFYKPTQRIERFMEKFDDKKSSVKPCSVRLMRD